MAVGRALEVRIRAHLEALEADRLLRTPRPPTGTDLSSNDYLNLSTDAQVRAAFMDGIDQEGVGSTGSRLLRGQRDVFVALEREFAQLKRTDRALYFSSGYLANLAVLTSLPEASDVIFSDERNHASLIDACRLSRARRIIWPHNDVEALTRRMAEIPCSGIRFVVIESLYSMDGDFARLKACALLCRAMDAVLVVDEAHAVGIYGDRGSGLLETIGDFDGVTISINTAGKALGVAGAFVAGPDWVIEYLVQRARPFVFSTAPPPALAHALRASLLSIQQQPERRARLLARSAHLRKRLQSAGVHVSNEVSQIVPVMIGDNERAVLVADALQRDGFDVRAIRPPTVPPRTARLRVSVNAGISEATIDRFVDRLTAHLSACGIPQDPARQIGRL